jgi:hypothetical protein
MPLTAATSMSCDALQTLELRWRKMSRQVCPNLSCNRAKPDKPGCLGSVYELGRSRIPNPRLPCDKIAVCPTALPHTGKCRNTLDVIVRGVERLCDDVRRHLSVVPSSPSPSPYLSTQSVWYGCEFGFWYFAGQPYVCKGLRLSAPDLSLVPVRCHGHRRQFECTEALASRFRLLD